MNHSEENLKDLLRIFSAPVEDFRRRLSLLMSDCGLCKLIIPGTSTPDGSGRVLAFSRNAVIDGAIVLTASLADEGSLVLLELARSLAVTNPGLKIVYVFLGDGEVDEAEFFCQGEREDFFSYQLFLALMPARKRSRTVDVLAIRVNDDDPYLPEAVLPRMRHFGFFPLYHGSRNPCPPDAARRAELTIFEPYGPDTMGRLALWLEEFLFVIEATRLGYLFRDEEKEIGSPGLAELEARFLEAVLPGKAETIRTPGGTVDEGALREELGKFFDEEAVAGEQLLFTSVPEGAAGGKN